MSDHVRAIGSSAYRIDRQKPKRAVDAPLVNGRGAYTSSPPPAFPWKGVVAVAALALLAVVAVTSL
jgi:hypothetical protein